MSNEPKACAHCGGDHIVEEWRRLDDRTDDWTMWKVMCGKCGISTDWYGTREAAIAVWNTRADEFGADDDYERRMDELLCRLTNGKWSKSRSYSVDFMVSCVDEAYDEILDPPVERHYAPRNTRADDAHEQPVESGEVDSRERLEADVYEGFSDVDLSEQMRDVLRSRVHMWLDRQVAITKWECAQDAVVWVGAPFNRGYGWRDVRELLDRQETLTKQVLNREHEEEWQSSNQIFKLHNNLADASKRIAELTAEVEAQRKRANDAERGVLSEEWYVCRDRYEDDIAELKAERDLWNERARQAHDYALELTAERDELQSIIDHMPKAEAECEACQEAHDRLMFNAKVDMDELRDELKHKQLVIDRQRDSFLKLEAENAELRKELDECSR